MIQSGLLQWNTFRHRLPDHNSVDFQIHFHRLIPCSCKRNNLVGSDLNVKSEIYTMLKYLRKLGHRCIARATNLAYGWSFATEYRVLRRAGKKVICHFHKGFLGYRSLCREIVKLRHRW